MKYKSPYEAYPFLSDDSDDLRCDFELLTDDMSSRVGLLRAHVAEYEKTHGIKIAGSGVSVKARTEDSGTPASPAASAVSDVCLYDELGWIAEMLYHLNPSLRTSFKITEEECTRLKNATYALRDRTSGRCKRFVVPIGGVLGSEAHVLRVQGKSLVRLVYRNIENGVKVPDALVDFANLVSGYFFFLALYLNDVEGVEEIPFESRNY